MKSFLYPIITILALATSIVANPVPAPSISEGAQVGPLPIDELRAAVAEMKLNERDLNKRITEGVYMCDGHHFSGSCYYGAYPISVGIYPSAYWVSRIRSVGPDKGGQCFFFGGECNKAASDVFEYPGGDLTKGISKNLHCFFCNPI